MKGFGCRILAYDPYTEPQAMEEAGVIRADLETILKESDYLSVHVPLTKDTKGMINQKSFQMMKPTAVIVNTARGGVVDESALISALKSGRIAGAGVDVYETEPVDSNNPLLYMDNVIATPHCAWF